MRLSSFAILIALSILNISASASDYRGLTESFINTPSESWRWSDFTKIDEITWDTKSPQRNNNYSNERYYLDSLKVQPEGDFEWSTFNVYGTKDRPTELYFQATNDSDDFYDTVRFALFNPVNLTEVKSNCTTSKIRPQNFYKWKKSGFKPLYIYQSAYGGRYGSFYDINIYEDYNEMVKSLNEVVSTSVYRDDLGNEIEQCLFDI